MDRSTNPWENIAGKSIPSTLELDPVLYEYTSPGCKILDIGCGTGKVSIPLASQDFSVTGIDINPEALQMAGLSVPNEGTQTPRFVQTDATHLPFPDETFDVAIMQAFLTTIVSKEERSRVIKEAHRILKPQGHLYLADFGQTWHSQIYRERYIKDLSVTREMGSFLARDEKTGEVAFIAHHFTEKELVFLLIENRFSISCFKQDEFTTRTGNRVNGFVIVGRKSLR